MEPKGCSIRVVSGGQTGADRAALDVAIELGLEVGGWVPLGRAAEDGMIPPRYPNLKECESEDPTLRTALNVRDSDATLILSHGPLVGGSVLTQGLARELGKPVLHLDLSEIDEEKAARSLRQWLAKLHPATLNVAGPRASEDPGIHEAVRRVLRAAFEAVA